MFPVYCIRHVFKKHIWNTAFSFDLLYYLRILNMFSCWADPALVATMLSSSKMFEGHGLCVCVWIGCGFMWMLAGRCSRLRVQCKLLTTVTSYVQIDRSCRSRPASVVTVRLWMMLVLSATVPTVIPVMLAVNPDVESQQKLTYPLTVLLNCMDT